MVSAGFVTIGSYPTVGEAELIRGHLAAAGISVRLANAQTLGVLPMHSLALGGVGVVVPSQDAARARESVGLAESDECTQDEETEPGSAIALQGPDAWMRRAAVSAGFGSLLVPVVPTLYSLYLLVRHGRGLMSRRGRRHRTIAGVFNAIAVAIAVAFLSC